MVLEGRRRRDSPGRTGFSLSGLVTGKEHQNQTGFTGRGKGASDLQGLKPLKEMGHLRRS